MYDIQPRGRGRQHPGVKFPLTNLFSQLSSLLKIFPILGQAVLEKKIFENGGHIHVR